MKLFKQKYLFIPLIFFLIVTSISLVLYNNNHYIYEIGFVEQAEYNTLNGNFFNSVSNGGNHFARHNSTILFIFLPIYYLFENITIFIILTNLLIAVSAVPVYLFAKEYLNNKKAGIVMMISYLIFPSFYYSNLRSFHPIMLAAPLMVFALYFFFKNKNKLFLLFTFIVLLTNETMSLLVLMFGIIILGNWKLKKYKLGLILIIAGLLWFQISTSIIMPHFNNNDGYPYITEIYGHLGNNLGEVVKTIITRPTYAFGYNGFGLKIIYLKEILQHNIFLSLLAPEILLIGLPVILQNILSGSSYKYDILAHYTFVLIPLIIFSTIIAIRRISKNIKTTNIILMLILVTSVISWFNYGIVPLAKENCYLYDKLYYDNKCPIVNDIIGNSPKQGFVFIKEAISNIPQNASVMAQNHLFYLVSAREKTYLFRSYSQCNFADYVVLDTKGNIEPINNINSYIDTLTSQLKYSQIYNKENIYLFKKNNNNNFCIK